ncbi:MAG: ABC transporter ATP-binding protein [Paludibacteraceae bacterium]|nr:ABC transporter ATP-binding protein [Paludibacteraceae bacterium]
MFNLFRRFLSPYKWYVIANIFLNLITAIFNLFSFASIIPILQILFGMDTNTHTYIPFSQIDSLDSLLEIGKNNIYAYIEALINQHGASTALMLLGLYLIIMTLLKTLSAFLASASLVPIRTGILRDIRNTIYRKITSLHLGYFSHEKKGDIISRITNDVVEVEASIISSLETIFKNPIMILLYLIVLFTMSWRLTIFVLILLPISGLLIGRIGKSLKRKSLLGQQLSGELIAQIEETLGGLRVVKAFNAESKLNQRFQSLNETIRHTFNRIHIRYFLAHPISEFLGTAVIAILLWYGGYLILSGKGGITAPEFIYYLVIFYSIINPFKELSRASYSIQKGLASLQRIDAVLDAENKIIEPTNPQNINSFNNEIRFNNVSFKYQDEWVLKNINLTIPKGQTVALVGQSGSGKSTLVDLIPRFYDTIEGSITIDGIDIRNLSTHNLRHLMGNVNQEAILFNDTIYNNITFGVESATQSEVEHAARIANAHDFIMATPDGYQTNIGDRGSRLSGGQRQRISIARAILKNPPILILDEATSALDTESERLVQEAIEQLMLNRTAIVIAHRLSTIKSADLICVLHEGQIIEQGTHEQLIALNGQYKKLCDMQNF